MGWGLALVLTGSLPRCRLEEIDIGRLSVASREMELEEGHVCPDKGSNPDGVLGRQQV